MWGSLPSDEVGKPYRLRNEMSKLSALKTCLWLDLFVVMLQLYLRDLPFQARLLLAQGVVSVGFHVGAYDF